MKGLYVSNIDPSQSVGYMTKILGQVQGFRRLGCDMDLICFDHNSQVVLTKVSSTTEEVLDVEILALANYSMFGRRINLLRAAIAHIQQEGPSFLYLRYPRSEPLYLFFLTRLRKRFPDLIIISEFPTYPYDQEYENQIRLKDKIVFWIDRLTRQFLKNRIDRIVSINYEEPIFGINTISIDNGVNVSDYTFTFDSPVSLNSVDLIGVANVSVWHGYDRLITGLGNYYRQHPQRKCKVIFHIVGATSNYLEELETLAKAENVSDYVTFYQPQQGKVLDRLFENCCVAIGVLGGHRKNLTVMSPLKNREYCARGIPFIFSHIDPDFTDDFPYCLRLPSDDSPIDIEKVLIFINQLSDHSNVVRKMRDYAYSSLDWASKLKPVKTYIDNQQVNKYGFF